MVSPAPSQERATSGRCQGAGETKQPLLGAGDGAPRPASPAGPAFGRWKSIRGSSLRKVPSEEFIPAQGPNEGSQSRAR